jgi:hypothetical protein
MCDIIMTVGVSDSFQVFVLVRKSPNESVRGRCGLGRCDGGVMGWVAIARAGPPVAPRLPSTHPSENVTTFWLSYERLKKRVKTSTIAPPTPA